MYNYISEKIKKIKIFFFLKKKNRFFFNTKSKNNKINLIEYNNFHGSHLCQALLSNFLKRKNSGKIVAYYNYALLVSPLKINYLQKIKWHLSCFLDLGFKGIYRSFGVDKFIRPEIKKKFTYKAELEIIKFLKKNPNNNKIINLKINNIWIGDLLYDTYLKSKYVPTIDIKDKDFHIFFKEFLELFFYWKEFYVKNNVISTTGVHSCYSYGIPLRLSMYNKIPTYIINTRAVMRIDKKVQSMYGDFKFHKKKFSDYLKNNKKKCLKIAKKNINLRLNGQTGLKVGLFNREKSSFSKKSVKSTVLLNNSKIKILICTHDFLDSIHVNGKNLFPDFKLWLLYLGKLSEKKSEEYDFYIKNHPKLGNKYEKYQNYTDQFVDEILINYPRIKKISSHTSHHQLLREGIKFVLTVYGSVGIEYAYLGIPVINASRNNPHINYKFNINPKNRSQYKKILNNLKQVKLKINKNEVLECYFMKHFFYDENWLFNDYRSFMKNIGGYHNTHTDNFYEYWLKNVDIKFIEQKFNFFKNFIDSNENRLSIFDSEKEKLIN